MINLVISNQTEMHQLNSVNLKNQVSKTPFKMLDLTRSATKRRHLFKCGLLPKRAGQNILRNLSE